MAPKHNVFINTISQQPAQQQMWQAAATFNSNLAGTPASWAITSAYSSNGGAQFGIMATPVSGLNPMLYVAETNALGAIVASSTGFVDFSRDFHQLPASTFQDITQMFTFQDADQNFLEYKGPTDKALFTATLNGKSLGMVSPGADLGLTDEGGLHPLFQGVDFRSSTGDIQQGNLAIGVAIVDSLGRNVDLVKMPISEFHVGVNSSNITGFIKDAGPVTQSPAQSMFSSWGTSGNLTTNFESDGSLSWKIGNSTFAGYDNVRSWSGVVNLSGTHSLQLQDTSFITSYGVSLPGQLQMGQPQKVELGLNMQYAHLDSIAQQNISPFNKDLLLSKGTGIMVTPQGSYFESYGPDTFIGLAGKANIKFTGQVSDLDILNVDITLNPALKGPNTVSAFNQGWHKVTLAQLGEKNIYQPNFGDLATNKAIDLNKSSITQAWTTTIPYGYGTYTTTQTLPQVTFTSALTDSGVRNLGFKFTDPQQYLQLHAAPLTSESGAGGVASGIPGSESGTRGHIERVSGDMHNITTPMDIKGAVVGLPMQITSGSYGGYKGGLAFGEGTRFWSSLNPGTTINSSEDIMSASVRDQYVHIGNDYAWNLQGNRIDGSGRLTFDMETSSQYYTGIYDKASAQDLWQDPSTNRILRSEITSASDSLGFGSLALSKLGQANPTFSTQVFDKNATISQTILDATNGNTIKSISAPGEVGLLNNQLFFKAYESIYARPSTFGEGAAGGPALDLGYSEFTLTKVGGAETIYQLDPSASYAANMTLGFDSAAHWTGLRTGQQANASIDFSFKNAKITFGTKGDYALGVQSLSGMYTATGGFNVNKGESIVLDPQGNLNTALSLSTAGFWQPILDPLTNQNRTFTVNFQDANGNGAVGAFNKRISWDRNGNISGIDTSAFFQTEPGNWRNVAFVEGGQNEVPLSITLSQGRQRLFMQSTQGAAMDPANIILPTGNESGAAGATPETTRPGRLSMTLGTDGWLSGPSSNFISGLNYNFSGGISQDLRNYDIVNDSGFRGDLGFNRQSRDGQSVAEGGLVFDGAREIISFNEFGNLTKAHAGYLTSLNDPLRPGYDPLKPVESYTVTFQDALNHTVLGEFNKRISWNDDGLVVGIDDSARFMTESGIWRDVVSFTPGDSKTTSLSVNLSAGENPLFAANISNSADSAGKSPNDKELAAQAPESLTFLSLGEDGMLSGSSSN
ncbi:MAG: hypothetical protein COV73_06535, partial [Candidatus Omnitrophica bacterium CG11_big_fil_rev_8_21_14_0_20_43_6]